MASEIRKHSITFLGVGIATALTVGVGYYVVSYKGAREHYFSESRRRQLGVLAEQMESAIDNRFSSLRNAVGYAFEESTEGWKERLEDQLRLAGLGDVSCEPRKVAASSPPEAAAGPSPQPSAVRTAEEGDHEKGAAATQPMPKVEYVAETLELLPAANVQARETAGLDFDSTTGAGSPVRKRNRKLRFCYDRGAGTAGKSASNAREEEVSGCDSGRACASVALDNLIDPFLRGDGFSPGDLFVARGADILFESGSTDVRIGSLLEGKRKDEGKSDKATTPTPGHSRVRFPVPTRSRPPAWCGTSSSEGNGIGSSRSQSTSYGISHGPSATWSKGTVSRNRSPRSPSERFPTCRSFFSSASWLCPFSRSAPCR